MDFDNIRVGKMAVGGTVAGCPKFLVRGQAYKLFSLLAKIVVVLIEDFRQLAPTNKLGQLGFFFFGCRPLFNLQFAEHPERFKVILQLAFLAFALPPQFVGRVGVVLGFWRPRRFRWSTGCRRRFDFGPRYHVLRGLGR